MTDIRYKLFQVGGHVRDALMGVKSNDIDYTVVVENPEDFENPSDAFAAFESSIVAKGFKVFLSMPEVFTIRSKFPDSNEVADFVLSRKESGFKEGTRLPEKVELGTLEDDLRRRDFTVNAMAFDEDGNLVDPFNGSDDLDMGLLKTPVSPEVSFNDDPLRIVRGLRFSVTRDFLMDSTLWEAISNFDVERFKTVSKERVSEELKKMFMHDTMLSMDVMFKLRAENNALYKVIFEDCGIRLMPTLKPKS